MSDNAWPQRPAPRIEASDDSQRRLTWLELFQDLIFVAVIGELSSALSRDPSWVGFRHFLLLGTPAVWTWLSFALYDDRLGSDDASHRLFALLRILPVAGLALAVHGGIADATREFAFAYVVARLLLIGLWTRGGRRHPPARPLTRRYAIGLSIAVVPWLISLPTPPPARYVLWAAGLAIDLATPLTTLLMQIHLPRLGPTRLPERFALFAMVVLGGSAAALVRGWAAASNPVSATAPAAALGLALIFIVWWLYFEHVAGRRSRPGAWWNIVWAFWHGPLVMSVAATSAGVLSIIAGHGDAGSAARLIGGAMATALLAIGAIVRAQSRTDRAHGESRWAAVHRLAGVAAILAVGLGGGSLSGVALLSLLAAACVSQILYYGDKWIWETN
jgi:low temperature requirement protein LtrA